MKLVDLKSPHVCVNAKGELASYKVGGEYSAIVFADEEAADDYSRRFAHLKLEVVPMIEKVKP